MGSQMISCLIILSYQDKMVLEADVIMAENKDGPVSTIDASLDKLTEVENEKEDVAIDQNYDERHTTVALSSEKEIISSKVPKKESTKAIYSLPIPSHASDWMNLIEEGEIT